MARCVRALPWALCRGWPVTSSALGVPSGSGWWGHSPVADRWCCLEQLHSLWFVVWSVVWLWRTKGQPSQPAGRPVRSPCHALHGSVAHGHGWNVVVVLVHSHSDTARPPKVLPQHVGEGVALGWRLLRLFMSFVAVCPLTERIAWPCLVKKKFGFRYFSTFVFIW